MTMHAAASVPGAQAHNAKKQEKLAHKRPRKQLDHADQWRNSNGRSDLGIQAGVKVGTNQPAVHPLDGTRKSKDPSWLAVTLPTKKKKKTSSGQGIWTGRSPVSKLWTSWWRGAPQHSSVAMPGPLNRLAHTTLPLIPALGAFIGPKQRNIMIVLEMASTTGTCHWVSTAPDGIDTTDEVFSRAPGASLNKQRSACPTGLSSADGIPCTWPGPPPAQMLCQQAAHARPKPTSLNVNLYNMHSRPNSSSALTRFFWALAYQLFTRFAELVSP